MQVISLLRAQIGTGQEGLAVKAFRRLEFSAGTMFGWRVRLPDQKAEVLKLLNDVIARKDTSQLRPEFIRAL